MSQPTEVTTQASCCDDEFDPALLTVDAALERISATVTPITDIEVVPLRAALSRVLGQDLHSPVDVPNHTNSAMDGYALRFDDLSADRLTVIGTAWAGKAFTGVAATGQCVRIMTGAIMPEGTDTVVMQEQVERNGDTIRVAAGQKRGQHIRRAGEDLAQGSAALHTGQTLMPADLGLVASLGIGELPVLRKPRVAFFSNGDELRSIGEPLELGEVYDSNRYTLHGMLSRLGVAFNDLGVVPDDRDLIRDIFLRAANMADVVITSAGASVGDADYVKDVLDEIGEVRFWKIAMKPGRPLSFGRIGKTFFFGLPGNPVSVMVTFYQFVLPALKRLAGEKNWQPLRLTARTKLQMKKKPGRTEFQRGQLAQDRSGTLTVTTTGEQGSGILSSMSQANCFVILPLESAGAEVGDTVIVEPFAGLV
ncbi:MAG: molybdopterin-binding protein [Arenicellales bacterium]|jgi:molybdopterin molybdotransferase|nr:molybdopterin-binding protein [Arenicellales bacterium]MDP6854926.1 molybdopterin-binding protein [Arenicellales bacterium]MDP6947580.1 molybdopterin-binding protein [Arenicellales bacterium]